MTTHRNLKPHYAERKGKSGPVIVVKKANCSTCGKTENEFCSNAYHLVRPLDSSDDMQADTFRELVEPRKCVRHRWEHSRDIQDYGRKLRERKEDRRSSWQARRDAEDDWSDEINRTLDEAEK
jgi:hypothetical protein